MKKIHRGISVSLVLAFVVGFLILGCSFPTAAKAEGYGSNGKFLAPIEAPVAGSIPISNRAELEAVASNLSGNYHLTRDIDLSGAEWMPIGDYNDPFVGVFDGQGNIITSMTITEQASYAGLFGYVAEGTVKNVGMESGSINVTDANNGLAGSIVGNLVEQATVENSFSTCDITISSRRNNSSRYFNIGGIVGTMDNGNIINCRNAGDILFLINGYLNAIWAQSDTARVGGIVGYARGGTVKSSSNTGSVTVAVAYSSVACYAFGGGITGSSDLYDTFIEGCFNTGNVTVTADSVAIAGGIISIDGIIENCYNTGDISAMNSSSGSAYSGGVMGRFRGSWYSAVLSCYSVGNVKASAIFGSYAGGIAGDVSAHITNPDEAPKNCYFTGSVTSVSDSDDSNYCEIGTQLTVAQMNEANSFVGFDFENIWAISPSINNGYPYLRAFVEEDNSDGEETELYIKHVLSPADATLSHDPSSTYPYYLHGIQASGKITANAGSNTNAQQIRIVPSISDATVKLYHENHDKSGVFEELSGDMLPLQDGVNYAFIELAATGFDKVLYFIEITAAISPPSTKQYTIWYPKENGVDSVDVSWGGRLFNNSHPSTQYNHDLALVAAALTGCSKGKAEYLSGTGSAYEVLGLSNDEYFNYLNSYETEGKLTVLPNSTQSEQCFSIASQRMTIDGKDQMVVVVILRGTETLQEGVFDYWQKGGVVNFSNSDYKVYKYFLEYADKAFNALQSYLNKHEIWEKYESDIKVLIAGHSLGGAAANLMAARFQLVGSSIPKGNIYTYTYGALNTLEYCYSYPPGHQVFGPTYDENATYNQVSASGKEFSNIFNLFNFYDTFGTQGRGAAGGTFVQWIPAYGDKTTIYKFGRQVQFNMLMQGESLYRNHDMPCYIEAINRGYDIEPSKRLAVLCPVDIDVFDSENKLVGRFKNNTVDMSVSSLPLYVEGDAKYILLPGDAKYSLILSAFGDGAMEYFIENIDTDEVSRTRHKGFVNVALTAGKKMYSEVGGTVDVPDTKLYVLDDFGNIVAEILPDGTEVPIASSAPGAASVSNVTISGSVGIALGGGQAATISIVDDTIANNLLNEDASEWFHAAPTGSTQASLFKWLTNWPFGIASASASSTPTGLPAGITVTATASIGSNGITLTFGGTPLEPSTQPFYITIPGSVLTGSTDIAVTDNPNAKFNIAPERPSGSVLPQTGDNFPLTTLLALLGVTLVTLGWLGFKMRTRKAQR